MNIASFRPCTTAVCIGVLMGLLHLPLMAQVDPLGDLIEQKTSRPTSQPAASATNPVSPAVQSNSSFSAQRIEPIPIDNASANASTNNDASTNGSGSGSVSANGYAPSSPPAVNNAWGQSAASEAATDVPSNPAMRAAALSALNLPSLFGSSAGNVAGVLQYCVQNNYLNKARDRVSSLKEGLLNVAGLQGNPAPQTSNANYANGLAGILQGGEGERFDIGQVQANLKEMACTYVLEQAPSLL